MMTLNISAPASLPGGKERTLTLNALSKTYAMTGWRTGWVTGPADLMARVRDMKAAISGPTSVVAQHAALAAITGPQDAMFAMREAYIKRRKIVLAYLDEMGFKYGHTARRTVHLCRCQPHGYVFYRANAKDSQRGTCAGLSGWRVLRRHGQLHPHHLFTTRGQAA